MRPTIDQLRGWNLQGLATAGTAARDNARLLDGSLDSAEKAIDGAGDWYGKTHDAATVRTDQEFDHGREVRNVFNRIADDAEDAARTLQFAKDFVIREVDLATGQGFTVSPTGEVAHPDAEKAEDADHKEHSIQSGLDEVDRLDTMYGTPLRDAAGDLAAMKEGQPDVTMPNGQRADPDEVVDLLGRMPSADERAPSSLG